MCWSDRSWRPASGDGSRRCCRARRPCAVDHVDDLGPYAAAANVLVSRGGYNTVCEILSFGRPALSCPAR